MQKYFNNIFSREHLKTNKEILNWWNKGRKGLTIFFIAYSLLHFLFIYIFLENGFVFFLLPMIPLLVVIINVVFSFGLIFEILTKKVFKSNINFDKLSPKIKASELIFIGLFAISLSIWNILDLI